MNEENRRVLLGMSGGVDSSAAALVLQREGWEVTGVTMRLHKKEPSVQEGAAAPPTMLKMQKMLQTSSAFRTIFSTSPSFLKKR